MLRRHGNQVNEISSDDVTSLSLEYEDEKKNEVSDTFVLSVSRDPEKLAAAEKAEKKEKEPEEVTGYVRIGESQIIYEISQPVCNAILAASSYNQVFFIENSRFFNLSYLSELATVIDISMYQVLK